MNTGGRLAGIARHDRPRGPIETVERAAVTVREGLEGCYRGALKPDGPRKRQISILSAEDWETALAEIGETPETLEWWKRRANLLVSGVKLPRRDGALIHIGDQTTIEVVQECDPCSRMDEIRPGLKDALLPEWRGGVLGRVLNEGTIRVGDEVRIEE